MNSSASHRKVVAAIAISALPLAALSGCAARRLTAIPHQPTVVAQEKQGWIRVQQPGWFSVLMPHAPEHGELETSAPTGGVLLMKQLSTAVDGTTFAIAYAKLVGFDDHDALLAEVRKSLRGGGATPLKDADVVVAGRDGVEEFLDVPPESQMNPSKRKMTARVRVLLDSDRAYLLIGIEPAGTQNSTLPKFFDSFEFAPAREAEVL